MDCRLCEVMYIFGQISTLHIYQIRGLKPCLFAYTQQEIVHIRHVVEAKLCVVAKYTKKFFKCEFLGKFETKIVNILGGKIRSSDEFV